MFYRATLGASIKKEITLGTIVKVSKINSWDVRELAKEIHTKGVIPWAVQEEMFVILIGQTTITDWRKAVKGMPEAMLIQGTKLKTEPS